ncbi:MAG: hypothetical protein KDK51_02765 [Deltaproteobacteria bacterium]|nr:hypothetical protein [Deltaproteobacteria bacterium]
MKSIENHVESVLEDFEKIGILQDVLFIGAWARYFYKEHFKSETDYYPRLATKDLDILLPKEKAKQSLQIDLHQKLLEFGYQHQIFRNSLIKYYKNELELEFLLPTHGSKRIVSVKALNIKAQQLPYLEMLWESPIHIRYGKYQVSIPDPYDFVVHKLIISSSRSVRQTKLQDIRDAEEVLVVLMQEKGFESKLSRVCIKYTKNKKAKSKVLKVLPFLLDPGLRKLLNKAIEEK